MASAARSVRKQSLQQVKVAVVAAVLAALSPSLAPAKGVVPEAAASLPTVALTELPRQAQETHRLIRKGGPFPYEKDGTVFFNRERLLPASPRGYYREYTVKTPGVRHRGARRIVCGGRIPTTPDNCYYTDDHYASFRRIVD
ncbi:ribonuclease domain-containing protein [Caldimonas thermodepolymerans]|uniref:ribonuclease domain-containing protein n=1 Tax=Caldimonas thermodepolymerans TaxID=215580 RepID=UPI003AF3B301